MQPHSQKLRPLIQERKNNLIESRDSKAEQKENEGGADGDIEDGRHLVCGTVDFIAENYKQQSDMTLHPTKRLRSYGGV